MAINDDINFDSDILRAYFEEALKDGSPFTADFRDTIFRQANSNRPGSNDWFNWDVSDTGGTHTAEDIPPLEYRKRFANFIMTILNTGPSHEDSGKAYELIKTIAERLHTDQRNVISHIYTLANGG